MKRSEINSIIREAEKFISDCNFILPPFAGWNPNEWKLNRPQLDYIVKAGMGWDITDFGKGDFKQYGLVLFTLRNGFAPGTIGNSLPYAEKLLVSRYNQVAITHYHKVKTEDIIVRGGAPLAVKLNNLDQQGGLDHENPVIVQMDGIQHQVDAGGTVIIEPGASITLEPRCVHSFWGHEGTSLVGEVSSVNDDKADNFFFEDSPRFPMIEADESPYRLIVPDYLA